MSQFRYSLEYLDKDKTIVVHMAGGIDAYIKLSLGWPIFVSPLKLICIKGSDDLKRTSLSFHCKVEVREFQSVLAITYKFSVIILPCGLSICTSVLNVVSGF